MAWGSGWGGTKPTKGGREMIFIGGVIIGGMIGFILGHGCPCMRREE